MKLCAPIAAALLAITLAGCAQRTKAKVTPPAVPGPAVAVVSPPTEPLSAPQTHVQLPPPQPLNPEALVVAPPPQAPSPAAPQPPAAPATRRLPVASSTPPKPDPPPPTVTEPARPSIQEVLPQGQRNQLQEEADTRKKRIHAWLDANPPQRLNNQGKTTRDLIQGFLKASDDAEHRGDMREAAQLAERAEILIQGLQGGR